MLRKSRFETLQEVVALVSVVEVAVGQARVRLGRRVLVTSTERRSIGPGKVVRSRTDRDDVGGVVTDLETVPEAIAVSIA